MTSTSQGASVAISGSVLEHVCMEARRALPGECCGALLGPDPGALAAALPLRNEAGRAGSYLVGPESLQVAEAAAATAGLELVGFYHSHPASAPMPSPVDLEAAWPWYTYLLVDAGTGAVRAWTLAEDRSTFVERAIEVEEGRP